MTFYAIGKQHINKLLRQWQISIQDSSEIFLMYDLKKSCQYKISMVAKLMNKGRKVTQNLSMTNM